MRPSNSSGTEGTGVVVQQREFSSVQLDFGARSPLSFEALELVYAATDWGVLLRDSRAARAYGFATRRLSPLAMFRALALPFLIQIESEEALAREVQERDRLRRLCGFEGEAPTRAMFWHFRHTPLGYYPDTMLKLLVGLGLSARSLSMSIPCVRSMPDHGRDPAGEHIAFRLSPFGPVVNMWITPREGFLLGLKTAKPAGEPQRALTRTERPRRRTGLAGQLHLPAEFTVPLGDRGRARFAVDMPGWLRPGSGRRTRSRDTLTTVGSAHVTPYAASNVIVVRNHEGTQQVLLSRRLNGTWAGEYILPGGKAKPDETLESCTQRELEEETGLRTVRSKPISTHLVRLPGRPLVFSVGALVTEFRGKPRRRERALNEDWQWFDLRDLPTELALPAELALGEYLSGRRQGLEWSDVEILWQRSTRQPEQLRFGAPFALSDDDGS